MQVSLRRLFQYEKALNSQVEQESIHELNISLNLSNFGDLAVRRSEILNKNDQNLKILALIKKIRSIINKRNQDKINDLMLEEKHLERCIYNAQSILSSIRLYKVYKDEQAVENDLKELKENVEYAIKNQASSTDFLRLLSNGKNVLPLYEMDVKDLENQIKKFKKEKSDIQMKISDENSKLFEVAFSDDEKALLEI